MMQFRMGAQNAHKTTKGVAKDLQPAAFGIEWIHLAANSDATPSFVINGKNLETSGSQRCTKFCLTAENFKTKMIFNAQRN